MNITDSNTIAEARHHVMDLAIEQTGPMEITVSAGQLRFSGVDASLDSDDVFTAADVSVDVDVTAYVAKDTQNGGAIAILVDDVAMDGVDERYSYQRGDRYELIAHLYTIKVPANTTDLANVALTRHTIKEPS